MSFNLDPNARPSRRQSAYGPPQTFTPHKGLLALAERLVRIAERRTGLQLWDGEDGFAGVVEQKLKELKVPEKPIQLGRVVTPRQLAEETGFVKRKRAARRLKP